jgi:hypothetical protein
VVIRKENIKEQILARVVWTRETDRCAQSSANGAKTDDGSQDNMLKIALTSVGWLNYPNAKVQFRGVFSTDGHNRNSCVTMESPGQLKRKGVVDHKRKGLERGVTILGRQQINGRKKILQESGGLLATG